MMRSDAFILFRLDANAEIGSGHQMRCLTLANALKRPGVACHFSFVTGVDTPVDSGWTAW